MNETPPSGTHTGNKIAFCNYVVQIAVAIASPIVGAIYAVAVWGLTADLSITKSFPWSTGPFSNWMIWLGLALLSNVALLRSTREPAFGRR